MDDDGPDYRQQQELEEKELWELHKSSLKELKELIGEIKCTRQKKHSSAHSQSNHSRGE